MNETLSKLFAERRAKHEANGAATSNNDGPEASSQQETSVKSNPEGSVSDPICLSDDDDEQSQSTSAGKNAIFGGNVGIPLLCSRKEHLRPGRSYRGSVT